MSEQDERPVLPDHTTDEDEVGWGEPVSDDDADDTQRFVEERPPHHGD